MKNLRDFSIALTTTITFLFSATASAEIDSRYESQIEKACTTSVRTKKLKDLEGVCACIAKTHFESATHEPSESEAVSQLDWLVEYYSTADKHKLSDLMTKLPYMVDFDFQVLNDCLIQVRGK